MEDPQIKEVTVHWGGGGAVQLEEYGKQKSEYGVNVSRTYAIPPNWDEEAIASFEQEVVETIRGELEPIIQDEHDSRMEQRAAIHSGD